MQNEKLSLEFVLELTRCSRSKIFRHIAKGQFPAPVKAPNRWHNEGWLASDIQLWLEKRALSADLASVGLHSVGDLLALYRSCPPELADKLFPEMQKATLIALDLSGEVEA